MECIIEEIGGNITALATRDLFLFYGTVVSCKVDKIIQLFANVILNGVICKLNRTTYTKYPMKIVYNNALS